METARAGPRDAGTCLTLPASQVCVSAGGGGTADWLPTDLTTNKTSNVTSLLQPPLNSP